MVKKIILIAALVMIWSGVFRKNVSATSTCQCSMNDGRTWYILVNNCDPVTEYASGCEGTSNSNPFAKCECKKKEDSGLPPNTCICSGTGETIKSSCLDETPRENCVTRASPVYCYCSKETSNATDAYIAPRPGTPEAAEITSTVNTYDPTEGCGGNKIAVAGWCFPYDAGGIASKLIQIIFGIAGGIAFLLMVFGFIMVATSSGDEKKLQAAKETITSAIVGLLVSLFALFLFRLIAINILQIPGLT